MNTLKLCQENFQGVRINTLVASHSCINSDTLQIFLTKLSCVNYDTPQILLQNSKSVRALIEILQWLTPVKHYKIVIT